MEEVNRRLTIEQELFNSAYHDDLDGLRPIDLRPPPLQILLMNRMTEDFREAGSHQYPEMNEETMNAFSGFQSEWLLSPLPDYQGEVPELIIMRKLERHATTQAQKEHLASYKEGKLNDLYIQASHLFHEKRYESAQKRVDALLAVEPGHLFAARLRGVLENLAHLDNQSRDRQ
jgi:hypothetical protein